MPSLITSRVLLCVLVLLFAIARPFAEARLVANTTTTSDETLPLKGRLRETGGGWPACDPDVEQWSGYFDIPGRQQAKHYFYWAFGPRNKNVNAPVVLWMTGGPGCSSSLALLAELGPCWANASAPDGIERNAWAWNEEAYLLFVDQPAGVGFSYGADEDYDVNEAQVSEDMYNFLQAFLDTHSALRVNEFFVIGESYGGHYAPATAHRIFLGNQHKDGVPIRLAGLAVGNGLTDSYVQYPTYPAMAYDFCLDRLGRPCVSAVGKAEMESFVARCQLYVKACNMGNTSPAADACNQASHVCNSIPAVYYDTGLNPYDIRKTCEGELCYDFTAVDTFMNRADVQAALGVAAPGQLWESCNMRVNGMFTVDFFKNFNYTVPDLLAGGVRVMIYAGDLDFICNWIGNKEWVMALEWPGKAAFADAFDRPWLGASDGRYGGLIRAVADDFSPIRLSFVQVFDAGHMVPMDQPEAASRMLSQFLRNERFA